jgi:hypothetical protein
MKDGTPISKKMFEGILGRPRGRWKDNVKVDV